MGFDDRLTVLSNQTSTSAPTSLPHFLGGQLHDQRQHLVRALRKVSTATSVVLQIVNKPPPPCTSANTKSENKIHGRDNNSTTTSCSSSNSSSSSSNEAILLEENSSLRHQIFQQLRSQVQQRTRERVYVCVWEGGRQFVFRGFFAKSSFMFHRFPQPLHCCNFMFCLMHCACTIGSGFLSARART